MLATIGRQESFLHLQPAARVQFGLGTVLPHSNTPSLRVAGFEDEDDDEDEYEARGEPSGYFSPGASTTAASVVSSRKVKLS
jgi:hypothetical protein